MADSFQSYVPRDVIDASPPSSSSAGPAQLGARARVLRNTYALLALSMVPTVLGAWLGVATGIAAAMSPMVSMGVFLAGAFAFMFAIEKTKHSAAGVPVLLAFTFFMGLMLSRLVGAVLGLAGGPGLVMTAFAAGLVFFGMVTLSSVIQRDVSAMGNWLLIGAVLSLVAGIANVFRSLLSLLGIFGSRED